MLHTTNNRFILATVAVLCVGGVVGCLRFDSSPGKTSSEQLQPYTLVVTGKQRLTDTPRVGEYVTAWSPDGGRITFTAFHGMMGKEGIYVGLLGLDGNRPKQPQRIFPESEFREFGGHWSPDGKRISFISDRTGNYDIWTATPQGDDLRQLTTNKSDDVYGTWSPDGQRMAFLSTRSGEVSIWVMNADGSDQHQVSAGGNGDWGTAWSPDGQKILFGSSRISEENVPLAEGDPPLKDFFNTVFIAGVPSENIWLLDLPTRTLTRMTSAPPGRVVKHWHPNWSPDGRKVVYVSNQEGSADIWMMDRDGSHPTRLTTGSSYDVFPSWSPDGTRIAFSSAEHDQTAADIWVLTLKKVERV